MQVLHLLASVRCSLPVIGGKPERIGLAQRVREWVCLLGGADFDMRTTDASKRATSGALNEANRIKQNEVEQRWIS